MLDDLINSLDDSSDIKPLAILRQVDVSNDGISDLEDSVSGFK